MDEPTRAGQLLMVGLGSGAPAPPAVLAAVRDSHAGGLVLFGSGWRGADRVRAAVEPLQAAAGGLAKLLVAGNQEGGEQGSLQAFYGPGFDAIPAPVVQGGEAVATLEADAARWGAQLAAAGVNLDLAPVVDTVPLGTDAANAPIGAMGRELGHEPTGVATHGAAVVRGLRTGGVQSTLKHFPGLGRVRSNTDFSASGTVDSVTMDGDPYLQPFVAGVAAGARFVMVSSATYTRIDAHSRAVFSAPVLAMLRRVLGADVVAVSDDVGAAASVASVPVGERAVRFVDAGGDIVLTVEASQAPVMSAALVERSTSDPGFKARLDSSVLRVLRAKLDMGLLGAC